MGTKFSASRSWAVVRHELRVFRRDPMFLVVFTTMPLIVMAFVKPAFRANLVAIVLAGIGGALVPSTVLPSWARTVAPVTPSYWAMRGFRNIIVGGSGFGGVTASLGALAVFSVVFSLVAANRFSYNDSKT